MLAYHFVAKTLRDGSPIPANGELLEFTEAVKICRSGLHASKHPYDALMYAPGATLCLVECEDIIEEHKDKFVCRKRTILKRFDTTKLLQDFARYCALRVVHLWDAPQVVIDFLNGDDSKAEAAAQAAEAAAQVARVAEAAAQVARVAEAAAQVAWVATPNLQQHLREYFNLLVQEEFKK